jgi:hypothetical protein
MTKVESLKVQYPHLNISFLDLAKKLDSTKSHKYTPVICKILNDRFSIIGLTDNKQWAEENKLKLKERGIDLSDLSDSSIFVFSLIMDTISSDYFDTINDFIFYGEKGLLDKKDVLTYKNIEEIKNDISLASMKFEEKDYANQIYKEFENETWLALRPLTFESSAKYGAATKWCTTYRHDKSYFAKYWNRGVLVYFINKKTGYKFAGFKELKRAHELSFWNSIDTRIDSMELECDFYLYEIIKNIFKSTKSNSEFCNFELQLKVQKECHYMIEKESDMLIEPVTEVEYPAIDVPREFLIRQEETIGYIDYPGGVSNNDVIIRFMNESEQQA